MTAARSTVDRNRMAKDIQATPTALLTVCRGTVLPNMGTSFSPLTAERAAANSTAAVTVLMPPAVPTGEPETGAAVIRSNIRGDEVREYTVEILKTVPNSRDGRDMVLSVTDPELIEATGGIVQGMSGSPILQNGKLVGAVTHVLLNDPTKGYGISIETMLKAS